MSGDFEFAALGRISQLQAMVAPNNGWGSVPLGGLPSVEPTRSSTNTSRREVSAAALAASATSVSATFEQVLADASTTTGIDLSGQGLLDQLTAPGMTTPTPMMTTGLSSATDTNCPECTASGRGRSVGVIGSTNLDWSRATVPAGTPYGALFEAAGAKYGVDPKLLAAVAEVESSFDPTVTSPAGARGLMQLMPGTADSLGANPWDPASAIDGAARYLKDAISRFGVAGGLAAYNIGPGAVARNGGGVGSAHGYVDKVLSRYERGVQ
jgi:hypothetical protein